MNELHFIKIIYRETTGGLGEFGGNHFEVCEKMKCGCTKRDGKGRGSANNWA